MVRLLYLATLSLAASLALVLALGSPAAAQDQFDCVDFQTQEEAQAVYDQDPSDPYGLDGPQGKAPSGTPGVACEDLPSGNVAPPQQAEEAQQEATSEEKQAEEEKTEAPKTETTTETKAEVPEATTTSTTEVKTEAKKGLPQSGGVGSASLLALGAGALLIGGGLLVGRIVR